MDSKKVISDVLLTLTFDEFSGFDSFNEDVVENKLKKILQDNKNLHFVTAFDKVYKMYNPVSMVNSSSILWKYVLWILECLVTLKDQLRSESVETDRLLSVAQQKRVRSLLERIVNVGLLPNLLPGVEPLKQPVSADTNSALTDMQRYECLCIVTLVFVDLCQDETFHGIILPQFLSPLLCALCQLTMVPLKKSADTYPRLQRERLMFQKHLDDLVLKLYQPMVIKELMVIEGNKKCPRWLKRGVGTLLTRQLHRPRGLQAVMEAVRDAANCAAPTSPAYLETLARVVTASPNLPAMCAQILEMLDSSDAEATRFAVLCAKAMHNKDPTELKTMLLDSITQCLTQHPTSEQDLTVCINRLHKFFAVPASDLWCLPPQLLRAYIHILFRLNLKIYQSASHLRQLVEDLVWTFLSKCDDKILPIVFRCLIYNEEAPEIIVDKRIDFVFGDSGGVKSILNEESDVSLEEFGDSLVILLERKDTNGFIGNKLFVALLGFAAQEKEINTVDSLEKQLVTIKLLAVLSENEVIQKSISKDPEPLVKFLKMMIDSYNTGKTKETEIISIVLLVLSVILNDFVFSKNSSWDVFTPLEIPLFSLKSNTHSPELRLLAEEVYEVIMSHGAVKSKQRNCKVAAENLSSCEEGLRDARDALLPVRGHAMIQLGKLLAAGDKQAKSKKDQILCLFQENLKLEDSFLYLSAIEGLSIAAAEFPDTVIVLMVEQFSRKSLTPDTRLKVGEALVRVTKLLGDLVPVYKVELTNAFLTGTRDDDPMVRASSLSGLGELCRILAFRIGPILSEVLMCAQCIFNTDPSVEVRRAAVMLVSLLLKGLHKDTFTVLQDVLVELYQSLKKIYSRDQDDVTRLHAQLALEELNNSTLAFLFPKPRFTKQIFVLDPPS